MSILGPKMGKNRVFLPLKGARMNSPIGDKLFQDIPVPRRVAKFRENRPRDVEKSVDGKKLN